MILVCLKTAGHCKKSAWHINEHRRTILRKTQPFRMISMNLNKRRYAKRKMTETSTPPHAWKQRHNATRRDRRWDMCYVLGRQGSIRRRDAVTRTFRSTTVTHQLMSIVNTSKFIHATPVFLNSSWTLYWIRSMTVAINEQIKYNIHLCVLRSYNSVLQSYNSVLQCPVVFLQTLKNQ